ncbi:MAG: carbohydrate ABC transporter permease [Lachnospiraceae bacterium]|nr:carbohydrate ABC transporter permease [Lachnospiraceae bacterium]
MKKFKFEDFIFDFLIYGFLIAMAMVTILPVWHIIVASFSTSTDIATNSGLMLWTKNIDFGAYEMVFSDKALIGGFKNTLLYLGGSLPLNLFLTVLCGYFLACTNMYWKKPIAGLIMFTMFFNGGMIPNYLNIKDLGLMDSLWSLILSGALSVYNAVICKTAIEAIPESLKESAYIDGANDFKVIFKIILPLIKPTLAVLTLYYGVSHWNSWFNASIYIKDADLLPVQNVLRSILVANSSTENIDADVFNSYAETIKYAAIVVSTAPIMCVYPFLQKYFNKGVMIGAVKG